jgi:hypothetical protein
MLAGAVLRERTAPRPRLVPAERGRALTISRVWRDAGVTGDSPRARDPARANTEPRPVETALGTVPGDAGVTEVSAVAEAEHEVVRGDAREQQRVDPVEDAAVAA